MAGRRGRGACPACRTPITFAQAAIRRGRPFACDGCARRIIVPKAAAGLAIAAFALLSFFAGQVPWPVMLMGLGAALLVEWLLAGVLLAEEPPVDGAAQTLSE